MLMLIGLNHDVILNHGLFKKKLFVIYRKPCNPNTFIYLARRIRNTIVELHTDVLDCGMSEDIVAECVTDNEIIVLNGYEDA